MTAPKRLLRDLVEADLPALTDVWVAAWSEAGFAIDFAARRAWLEARLCALRVGGVGIVVGLDAIGRPSGFVAIDPASGHLDQLCVKPAERGSGLASALLDEAKRRSPGVVDLEVNEDNMRARRFYAREGFAVAGKGLNPGSGLPTINMRWTAQR